MEPQVVLSQHETLRAAIVPGPEALFTAAVVQRAGSPPWVVSPFRSRICPTKHESVGSIVAVDDRYAVAIAGSQCICLDAQDQRSTASFDFSRQRPTVIALKPNSVLALGRDLVALDVPSLKPIWSASLAFSASAATQFSEHGLIVTGMKNEAAIIQIVDGEPQVTHLTEFQLISVSRCGRKLVRYVPPKNFVDFETGEPRSDLRSLCELAASDPNNFLKRASSLALEIQLELWNVYPLELNQRVNVARRNLGDIHKFSDENDGQKRHILVAYLVDVLSKAIAGEIPRFWSPINSNIRWLPDDCQFAVKDVNARQDALVDSSTGEVSFVERGSWPDDWRERHAATYADYGDVADAFDAVYYETIELTGLDAPSCSAAIAVIGARMEKGDCSRGSALRFRFRQGSTYLSEPEFFAHVRKIGLETVPALRNLLSRFGWAATHHYDSRAAGLAYAAHALASIDPYACSALEKWFAAVDRSHETSADELVIPALIEHLPAAPREAFPMVLRWMSSHDSPWPNAVQATMDAARARMTPWSFLLDMLRAARPTSEVAHDWWKYDWDKIAFGVEQTNGQDTWSRQLRWLVARTDGLLGNRVYARLAPKGIGRWLPPSD